MRSTYREIAPSPPLASLVECFWTADVLENHTAVILPDGCADILFFCRDGELSDVQVVGTMTRPQAEPLEAGTSLLGIRFQPGMAGIYLGCDMRTLNDLSVPLDAVSRVASDRLVPLMRRRGRLAAKVEELEAKLNGLPTASGFHQAMGELVGRKGELSLDELAAVAGIGGRQLRRTCLKHSGLAPKHLARILRFRHALTRLRRGEQGTAELALDCGYYDQAHLIREFRELAGTSPGVYLKRNVA